MNDWLVVGCASSVWNDMEQLDERITTGIEWEERIIAVNSMSIDFPTSPMFGATVHSEFAHRYVRAGTLIVSPVMAAGVDIDWVDTKFRHGTSGLYAVGYALTHGASRVFLTGVPIDDSEHYNGPHKLGDFLESYRAAWRRILPELKDRVFSPSGWTGELLGMPK